VNSVHNEYFQERVSEDFSSFGQNTPIDYEEIPTDLDNVKNYYNTEIQGKKYHIPEMLNYNKMYYQLGDTDEEDRLYSGEKQSSIVNTKSDADNSVVIICEQEIPLDSNDNKFLANKTSEKQKILQKNFKEPQKINSKMTFNYPKQRQLTTKEGEISCDLVKNLSNVILKIDKEEENTKSDKDLKNILSPENESLYQDSSKNNKLPNETKFSPFKKMANMMMNKNCFTKDTNEYNKNEMLVKKEFNEDHIYIHQKISNQEASYPQYPDAKNENYQKINLEKFKKIITNSEKIKKGQISPKNSLEHHNRDPAVKNPNMMMNDDNRIQENFGNKIRTQLFNRDKDENQPRIPSINEIQNNISDEMVRITQNKPQSSLEEISNKIIQYHNELKKKLNLEISDNNSFLKNKSATSSQSKVIFKIWKKYNYENKWGTNIKIRNNGKTLHELGKVDGTPDSNQKTKIRLSIPEKEIISLVRNCHISPDKKETLEINSQRFIKMTESLLRENIYIETQEDSSFNCKKINK
jgi:hypothetical protein